MLGILESIWVNGLIYGITALGVLITFRILNFPDLTVDGSFPLGAVVMGLSLSSGQPLWIGFLLATASGILAGICSAFIHNYLKVPDLLSGILTMMMLYSVNIRILGRPNLPLLNTETQPIFARLREFAITQFSSMEPLAAQSIVVMLFATLLIIVVFGVINLFLLTDLGITLGALGSNQQIVTSYGLTPGLLKCIGLGLSNGLVAISGALFAQYQGFADIGLGSGIIIIGLAIVMMGEFCIRSDFIYWITFRVLLGAILYQALIYFARRYGANIGFIATDIKLMTGLLIIFFLGFSQIQKHNQKNKALNQALDSLIYISKPLASTATKTAEKKASPENDSAEIPEQGGDWL